MYYRVSRLTSYVGRWYSFVSSLSCSRDWNLIAICGRSLAQPSPPFCPWFRHTSSLATTSRQTQTGSPARSLSLSAKRAERLKKTILKFMSCYPKVRGLNPIVINPYQPPSPVLHLLTDPSFKWFSNGIDYIGILCCKR